jgi:Zn-dependent oligopeptidase
MSIKVRFRNDGLPTEWLIDNRTEAANYTKLWNDLRESISLVKGGKAQPGQGTFGHIVGGYDAGYYG